MSKKLVTYYSATGTTQHVAETLAKAIDADIAPIEPAEPYTDADLNWHDANSRTTHEQHDSSMRPALATEDPDPSDYDEIFIGFPLWWESDPRVIRTWIEAHDFDGKDIVTFATSGSKHARRERRAFARTRTKRQLA